MLLRYKEHCSSKSVNKICRVIIKMFNRTCPLYGTEVCNVNEHTMKNLKPTEMWFLKRRFWIPWAGN